MKRLFICVFAFVCALALARGSASADPFALFAAGPSEDAVAFQITPTHTGVIDGPQVKLPLRVKWNVNLGQSSTYPVIRRGRVFVGGGNLLYALNASTGKTLWSKASPSLGVAYDQGRIFTLSSGGDMAAFDPITGRQIWFQALQGQYAFSSPPTALNGIVYTGGAGSGGTVYAVKEMNGAVIWTASVANGDDSSPVVTNKGVFVSYVGPQTYDFNPLTGALIWHYGGCCEGGGGATPVLYQGLLYVESWTSSPTGLILNASNGTPVGTFASLLPPAFANNTAYIVNGLSLTATNTKTGNVVWTQTLNSDSFSVGALVVSNTQSGNLVICGTAAGFLYVYDAGTGHLLQTISLGAGVSSGMGFSEGLLVVSSGNNLVGLH
jgi:outer membrane protein assembly factor BamB